MRRFCLRTILILSSCLLIGRDRAALAIITTDPRQNAQMQAKMVVGFRINFARDSATLPADGLAMMNTVAQVMKEEEAHSIRVEIIGYTDASEGIGFSLELSLLRSGNVMAYLIKSGVNPEALTPRGMGPLRPIVPQPDPANSRVELIRTD